MAKAKGSTLGNLVPLIVLVLVVAILAAVGFVAYSIANDVGSQTKKKMEKKNISFTKDGMKVGVKEVTREQQEDSTQGYAPVDIASNQLLITSQYDRQDLEQLILPRVQVEAGLELFIRFSSSNNITRQAHTVGRHTQALRL